MANFILSAFADEAADTLDEQIEALHEAGISMIEPRSLDGKAVLDLSEDELRTARAKLDAAGISVYSLGSPIGKYPIDEPEENHLELFSRALRAAKILGAKRIRIFSYYVKPEEMAQKRDEVLSRLRRLVGLATAEGIILCHENEASIYGESPAGVGDILSSVEGLRGIFDPANFCMTGNDAYEGFRATLPRLDYCHIKDADRAARVILPAGEGDGRIADVLSEIDRTTDRTVTLTLEPHLFDFSIFRAIDAADSLRTKYKFQNNRESFAFAAAALKKLLAGLGYYEEEFIWKK